MTDKSKKESEQSLAKKNVNSKTHGSRLTFFSILLGLAALFAAAYSFKQSQLRDNSINQDLLITNKTISDLVDKQQEFKLAISKADELAKKQMTSFESQLKSHQQTMKTLANRGMKADSLWELKKAKFYLELAQINANWSQQPQTTIDLLKQADLILSEQHHPDVFKIRQQIANDIATIKKQSKIDIVGILTQLNAIQTQLQKLSYREDPLFSQKANDKSEQNAENEKWRQKLANSVNALEKLVVIRHHKESVKPILSDQEFGLVKESLYLDIQQAKWAVINRNQGVFQLAIEQAISEIQRQFNQQQTIVSQLITDLQSLQKIQLEEKTIIPNKALLLINEHMQSSDDPESKQDPSGGKS